MSTLFNLFLSFYFLLRPLYSVSAPPFPFEVQQPDGSKIPVRMFGHEYYNWMETEDGYVIDWVEDDARLGWYYSELDNTLKPLVFLVEFSDEDHEYTENQFQHLFFAEDLSPTSANFPSSSSSLKYQPKRVSSSIQSMT